MGSTVALGFEFLVISFLTDVKIFFAFDSRVVGVASIVFFIFAVSSSKELRFLFLAFEVVGSAVH